MARIAHELDTTVARVAIAWVQSRPGVASTIIGARTVAQLDDNLAAIDVTLKPEHVQKLGEMTKAKLDFPAAFLENGASFSQGGTTINGRPAKVWGQSPQNDKERY